MEINECIISSFYVKVKRANLDPFFKEKVIFLNFEPKSKYTFKEIGYLWMK